MNESSIFLEMQVLGELIKVSRKAQNITPAKIAIATGIDLRLINKLETGKLPDILFSKIILIARAMRYSPALILSKLRMEILAIEGFIKDF